MKMRTLCFALLAVLLLPGMAPPSLSSQTSGGGSIAGRYRLAADGRLFGRALELEFYRSDEPPPDAEERLPPSLSGIWNARVVGLPDRTILRGLRERPAGSAREFLYGRLYLSTQPRPLRCKLWRDPNGSGLYLRIYESGPAGTRRYSTHRLRPTAPSPES